MRRATAEPPDDDLADLRAAGAAAAAASPTTRAQADRVLAVQRAQRLRRRQAERGAA